jgi:hypothetical protein
MYLPFDLEDVLAGPAKAARPIEDVLSPEAQPGPGRRFRPISLRPAPCSSAA